MVLTPEEWVRQHLSWYLINELKYPKNLMAIEKRIAVNGKQKRFDLVVFNTLGNPMLLAECKAPNIAIELNAFIQAGQYNQILGANVLIVTNGITLHVIEYNKQGEAYQSGNMIPIYA